MSLHELVLKPQGDFVSTSTQGHLLLISEVEKPRRMTPSFPFAPRFEIFHPVHCWHSSPSPALLGLLLSWQQFIGSFRSYSWLPSPGVRVQTVRKEVQIWGCATLAGRSRQDMNIFCKVWYLQKSKGSVKRQPTTGMGGFLQLSLHAPVIMGQIHCC